MKKLLWLDDARDPFSHEENAPDWLIFSPIERPFETIWVKSYREFIEYIAKNGLPDAICFDHDLGLDVAKEKIAKGMPKNKRAKNEKELNQVWTAQNG